MRTDISAIINRARRRLGLEQTTMHEATLRQYADEGVNHLQLLDNYIVSCEIVTIECGKGDLPEFCDSVIAVSPVSNDDGSCCLCSGEEQLQSLTGLNTRTCACLPFYVSDSSVLMQMNSCGVGCGSSVNIYYTQGSKIILNPNAEGQLKIYFRSRNVDSDGIMIVDEDWVRGVSAYVAYQFASSGSNFNKYNYRQIKGWEAEWVAQKSYWQGVSQKKYTHANKARFAAIANAIVTNPILALAPNP